MAKKTIPCRVCGKQFEPCAFCQKNGDTFRWRNFACSLECARKYVAEAIAYNEKMRNKKNVVEVKEEIQPIVEEVTEIVIETAEETVMEEITVEELVTEEIPIEEVPKKMKKKNYKN